MFAIIKKELRAHFRSSLIYFYICLFFTFSYWYFSKHLFILQQSTMSSFFLFSPYSIALLLSLITMSAWSNEKQTGTLDFLFSLPIRDHELVLGKFFSSLLLYLFVLISTIPLIFLVFYFGSPSFGPILSGYLGLLFLGISFISIGLFISALTPNPLISFVCTFVTCTLFYSITDPLLTVSLPYSFSSILNVISFYYAYINFAKGIISIKYSFFFIMTTFLFLYLNYIIFQFRRVTS